MLPVVKFDGGRFFKETFALSLKRREEMVHPLDMEHFLMLELVSLLRKMECGNLKMAVLQILQKITKTGAVEATKMHAISQSKINIYRDFIDCSTILSLCQVARG